MALFEARGMTMEHLEGIVARHNNNRPVDLTDSQKATLKRTTDLVNTIFSKLKSPPRLSPDYVCRNWTELTCKDAPPMPRQMLGLLVRILASRKYKGKAIAASTFRQNVNGFVFSYEHCREESGAAVSQLSNADRDHIKTATGDAIKEFELR